MLDLIRRTTDRYEFSFGHSSPHRISVLCYNGIKYVGCSNLIHHDLSFSNTFPFYGVDASKAWQVSSPEIYEPFRGKGLGKLLYAFMALSAEHQQPGSFIFQHDYIAWFDNRYERGQYTSELALRVWDSIGTPYLCADKAELMFDAYNKKVGGAK